MKSIVFLMPRLPFPMISGRKTSLYNYCKILHEQLGYRVVVLAFLETKDDPRLKPSFIDRLEILPNAVAKDKIKNICINTFIKRKWPIQVSLFWSPAAKIIVDRVIKEEMPVALISDMVRTTEYLRGMSCFKIADLDDLISLRYQRQLKHDLNSINPYGAYLDKLPVIIQKTILCNELKKFIIKQEIHLLEKYELTVSRDFDKTVFVANKEAEIINAKLNKNKAVSVPIGVDFAYFSQQITKKDFSKKYISFLGQMNVAHNENAVIFFIEKIFPSVLKQIPDVVFLVIGGDVTPRLKSFANKSIVFTGRVEDVRLYLQKSLVFVCPLTFGSGIKTKILEAMASGIAVVTTSIGAENIDAVNGQDWFIEDEPLNIAEKLCLLINDNKKNIEISENGQKYVELNWSWSAAQTAFRELLAGGL